MQCWSVLFFAFRVELLADGGCRVADFADHALQNALGDAEVPCPDAQFAAAQFASGLAAALAPNATRAPPGSAS
jgi:hypothetical protein